jgi:hypothetical protein
MNNPEKYEYAVETWGGFYNPEHKEKHGLEPGTYYFDSKEKRDEFMKERRIIEHNLKANYLMFSVAEGKNLRMRYWLFRETTSGSQTVKTRRSMCVDTTKEQAEYHLEYKWYPGFNDYPFGEYFDYDNGIDNINEWVELVEDQVDENGKAIEVADGIYN